MIKCHSLFKSGICLTPMNLNRWLLSVTGSGYKTTRTYISGFKTVGVGPHDLLSHSLGSTMKRQEKSVGIGHLGLYRRFLGL